MIVMAKRPDARARWTEPARSIVRSTSSGSLASQQADLQTIVTTVLDFQLDIEQ